MSLASAAIAAFERAPLPDLASRTAIGALVSRTRRKLHRAPPDATARFAAGMDSFPIALHTDLANRQHYELPPSSRRCSGRS
jgi:cyclopropane-fatty-acyl-phospholipid synthase